MRFEKAKHAMAVVHNPDEYKAVHVERLLAMVPEWKLDAAHSKGVVTGQVGRLFVCSFVCLSYAFQMCDHLQLAGV